MILYVVRHGETDENARGILQGASIDGPLNENGVRQIEEFARMVPTGIKKIYASPLKRVLQSAEIINKKIGVDVVVKDSLREREYGSLAGKSFNDLEDGEQLRELDVNLKYDYRPYGGESVEDVTKRIGDFLAELKKEGDDTALVVTSRGPVRIFHKILNQCVELDIPNGSLHTFKI